MTEVEVLGQIGPDGPQLFVLYTGGTIGMGPGPDGSLVPLDLRELGVHLPFIQRLPLGLTVATLTDPLDSSTIGTSDWLRIPGPRSSTMRPVTTVWWCSMEPTPWPTPLSAMSFLLEGIEIPIVLTAPSVPVTELRSDGRENLVTALAIASGPHLQEALPRPRGHHLLRRCAPPRQPRRQGPRRQLPGVRVAQSATARHRGDLDRLSTRARPARRASVPCGAWGGAPRLLRDFASIRGSTSPRDASPSRRPISAASSSRPTERGTDRPTPRSSTGYTPSSTPASPSSSPPSAGPGRRAAGSTPPARSPGPGCRLAGRHDIRGCAHQTHGTHRSSRPRRRARLMQEDLAGELTV